MIQVNYGKIKKSLFSIFQKKIFFWFFIIRNVIINPKFFFFWKIDNNDFLILP